MANIAGVALAEPVHMKELEAEKGSDIDFDAPSHAAEREVVFEDYLHFAAIQRLEEDGGDTAKSSWFSRLSDHKGPNVNVDVSSVKHTPMTITEEERSNASRALRLAGWAQVFYLITTDILGPFNAPFAISQVGWVPGIILYFVMGVMALYTGLILWRLYLRLDSPRHPVRSYGDIAERIYGRKARNVCNVLQSIQLIVNVATICLGNGQALSQVTKFKLCFAVCIVLWPIVGFAIGQIRTLNNYGWLANSAVWMNLLIIFTSMGFVAHGAPNIQAAVMSLPDVPLGPVQTHAFVSLPLFLKVNGILQMVFAYGGAMIFPEMLAEMRRPMDFWKGMTCAQALIFTAYLLYGCFIYAFQGQYTLPLAFQGVVKYGFQTLGNILSLLSGIIAAGLYGNIGIKVLYINIIENWFHGPRLMSHQGRVIWTIIVFVYWSLAFVIASAIPQIQTITGLIAAVAIMQFTYSFPPLLRLGYDIITDAMAQDGRYTPGMGTTGRTDTWKDLSRWKRGIFGGRVLFKLFNLIIGLGGLSMAGLGLWGAAESVKATFANAAATTSFSCKSPVG